MVPVVYLEHHSSSVFIQDEADVRVYRRATDVLTELAFGEVESRDLASRVQDG